MKDLLSRFYSELEPLDCIHRTLLGNFPPYQLVSKHSGMKSYQTLRTIGNLLSFPSQLRASSEFCDNEREFD